MDKVSDNFWVYFSYWWANKKVRRTLVGVGCVLLLACSWAVWDYLKLQKKYQSSAIFSNIVELSKNIDNVEKDQLLKDLESLVEKMERGTHNDVYAQYGVMLLTGKLLEMGKANEAEEKLRALLPYIEDEEILTLVHIILAKTLLEQEKTDEALNLLEETDSRSTGPIYYELKGDIQWSRNDFSKALESYRQAGSYYHNEVPVILLSKLQEVQSLQARK